jgi:hypothetical protein
VLPFLEIDVPEYKHLISERDGGVRKYLLETFGFLGGLFICLDCCAGILLLVPTLKNMGGGMIPFLLESVQLVSVFSDSRYFPHLLSLLISFSWEQMCFLPFSVSMNLKRYYLIHLTSVSFRL